MTYDIALVGIVDDESRVPWMDAAISESGPKLAAYSSWAFGVEVSVTTYAMVVDNLRIYSVSSWRDLKDRVRATGHNPSDWHMTGVAPASGWGGEAPLCGEHALTGNPGSWKVMTHEFGHTLCFQHQEGSQYSLMGGATSGVGFAAANLDYAGFIADEHKASGEGTYFLVRPETQTEACEGCHKIVYFEHEGVHYSAAFNMGRVVIDKDKWHEGPGPWPGVETVAELEPGEEWGPVIYKEIDEGMARINIGKASVVTRPMLPRPASSRPTSGRSLETAMYHKPEWNLQGLNVYVRDGTAYVWWFTWDEFVPVWLFGDGEIIDGVARLTLYAPDSSRNIHEVGHGYLWTEGKTHFYYAVDHGDILSGRGYMPLVKLNTPVEHPLYNVFHFEGRDHEGITSFVGLTEEGEEINVGLHFGYDNRRRPYWRYMEGKPGEALTVYEPKLGFPNTVNGGWLVEKGQARLTRTAFREGGRVIPLAGLIGETEKAA